MKVMAVNAGSSSLKYKLFEMPEEKVLCAGNADRIGHEDAIFKISHDGKKEEKVLPIMDHATGVRLIIDALMEKGIVKDLSEIEVVSHRVVQGGKYFSHSVVFDEDTAKKIDSLTPLDPLHAPAHLIGYRAFRKELPDALETAVFDTAYHQSMEEEDYLFPIPLELSKMYDIRRYGAHGTSHHYLVDKAIKDYFGGKALGVRIISCHIGSGASLTAARDGKCVATSMGLTPLGGVMMGTRTGDLDPSVMDYLADCLQKSCSEIYDIFNRKSGLLGVSGISNDTRDIEAAALKGDERAILSAKLFARRIADYVGQYYVRLGGADMIVLSAGIGENSPYFRKLILEDIQEALGLDIDYGLNETVFGGKQALLSKEGSKIKVAVIPTDEELMIARDGYLIKTGGLR